MDEVICTEVNSSRTEAWWQVQWEPGPRCSRLLSTIPVPDSDHLCSICSLCVCQPELWSTATPKHWIGYNVWRQDVWHSKSTLSLSLSLWPQRQRQQPLGEASALRAAEEDHALQRTGVIRPTQVEATLLRDPPQDPWVPRRGLRVSSHTHTQTENMENLKNRMLIHLAKQNESSMWPSRSPIIVFFWLNQSIFHEWVEVHVRLRCRDQLASTIAVP